MGGFRLGTSWSRSTASRPRTWRTGTPSSWSRLAARQSGSSSGAPRRPTQPSLVSDSHDRGRLISKHVYLQTRPASPPPHPPRSRWRAPSRHCRSPPRRPGQCHTPRPATRPTLEPCRPCSSPGPSTQPPGVTSDQAVRHWQYLVNRAVWLQPANKWPSPVSYYPLWFVQNKKLLISQKRKSFFWQIIEFLYLKIILVKFLKGWLSCRTSHQKQHWVSWNCANC